MIPTRQISYPRRDLQKKGVSQVVQPQEQPKISEEEKKKIDETISKLEKGEYRSEKDIPKEVQKYFNVPKEYWAEVDNYYAQVESANKQNAYAKAVNIYLGFDNGRGNTAFLRNLDPKIREKAKNFAESRERQAYRIALSDFKTEFEKKNKMSIDPKTFYKEIGINPVTLERVKQTEIKPIKLQSQIKPQSLNTSLPYMNYESLVKKNALDNRGLFGSGINRQSSEPFKYSNNNLSYNNVNSSFQSNKGRVIVSPKFDKAMDWLAGERGNKETDSKFDYYSKEYLPKIIEQVPIIVKDIAIDTSKGFTQAGFYLTDEAVNIGNLKKDRNGKLYIPAGKDIVGDWKKESVGGKIRDWSNYDWEKNPFKSREYQTAGMTTAFALGGAVGGLGGTTGAVGRGATKVGIYGLGGYQGYETIKNPTDRNIATLGLIFGGEVLANKGKIIQEVSNKKPVKFIPEPKDILDVSKTSRQRGTLMIKDANDNYLVSKKGISAGGKIEKGESPFKASLREAREELGLSKNDFVKIKNKGKIVTPEETFHVFEAEIKPTSIKKIKPSSDMADGIKWISPRKYSGVTGQTFRYPVNKGGVRVYELAIMNKLKNNQPVTWLGYDTKFGRVYFGTQSRYDVSGSIAKKYAKLNEELLAHGTPNIPLTTRYLKKGIYVDPAKNVRGGEGLYLQPPARIKPNAEGYIGLSYLGYGNPSRYELSLNPFANFKRRGVYILKDKVGKDIKITKKALRGKESEQAVKFGRELKPTGKGENVWVGGKKIRIQEMTLGELKEVNVKGVPKVLRQIEEGGVKKIVPYKIIPTKESTKEIYKNKSEYYNPKEYNTPYPTKEKYYKINDEEIPNQYYKSGENYKRYAEYNPYVPEESYTVYPTRKLEYKKRILKYPVNANQKMKAWRPIFYDDDGNKIIGDWFNSKTGAINEGFIGTDQSPATNFELQAGFVKRGEVKLPRAASKVIGKFIYRGGKYIEKKQFQKSTLPERSYKPNRQMSKGGMDLRPFIYGGN